MERGGWSSGKTARINFGLSERGVGSRLGSGVILLDGKKFYIHIFLSKKCTI